MPFSCLRLISQSLCGGLLFRCGPYVLHDAGLNGRCVTHALGIALHVKSECCPECCHHNFAERPAALGKGQASVS